MSTAENKDTTKAKAKGKGKAKGAPKRANLVREGNAVYKALIKVAGESRAYAEDNGIGRDLAELINVRASQLNGCVACLNQHLPQAREAGVPEQKLDLLPAWRESNLYDARERAALELTESLTLMPSAAERDRAYKAAARCLDEAEIAAVEWTAIAINAFNRVSIASAHQVKPRD
ncbi:carboxymuconolactone decarboxylase family protein [uncultured Corynebacterium sp.]|uniref:carboxymuconolactone decarboxylase family protein n=1 Tax=uncultured Corynebacterium sp. TaxID=159447 RepID=UPI0025DBDBF1|nr:carboxymuconolactone decarboxylase family protein [uncultured Corynebacterium sp.]